MEASPPETCFAVDIVPDGVRLTGPDGDFVVLPPALAVQLAYDLRAAADEARAYLARPTH